MKDLNRLKEEVSIVDYARCIGLSPKRIGRYYTLKEHDSVRIDPVKNLFVRNSTGQRGSVIDFAMAFTDKDMAGAIRELSKFCGQDEFTVRVRPQRNAEQEKSKELTLPKKDDNMKNVFAYLIRTRRIDQKIVREMAERHMLYQDVRKNCVFVSYDDEGKAVFAAKRGTNTYQRFVGDVPGCDYEHSFFIDNKQDALIITESVIDAMSVMDLLDRNGDNHENYSYLALSGTGKAEEAVKYHMARREYGRISVSLDNDKAGALAAGGIKRFLNEKYPNAKVQIATPDAALGKDFNDVLRACKEREEKDMGFKKSRKAELEL